MTIKSGETLPKKHTLLPIIELLREIKVIKIRECKKFLKQQIYWFVDHKNPAVIEATSALLSKAKIQDTCLHLLSKENMTLHDNSLIRNSKNSIGT